MTEGNKSQNFTSDFAQTKVSAKIRKLLADDKFVFFYVPILSVTVYFKDGKKCKFYSYELRTSISQIRFRDFQPQLDFDYGYQALINMVETTLKGKYNTAIIYKNANFTTNGIECRKYINDELVTMNDPDFNTPAGIEWKANRENWIKEKVLKCDACIDYSQKKAEYIF